MPKIVSQLDTDGYFIGQAYADPDPLMKGEHLILLGCVDLPPLSQEQIKPGMRYKPVAGKWIAEPIPELPAAPRLTTEEIAAAEATKRRAAALSEITALEAQQARPVREIIAALVVGAPPPTIAIERLAALNTQVVSLREGL